MGDPVTHAVVAIPPLHVEAMLHLAAMAVAVTAAYLGLDSVRIRRDGFRRELDRFKRVINRRLTEVDVRRCGGARAQLREVFNRSPVHVLCYVADMEMNLNVVRWAWHVIHRQRYVPMLSYFRNRFDRRLIFFLLCISSASFFWLTDAAIWEKNWIYEKEATAFLYWMYVAIILWIFLTVGVSIRLQSLSGTCDVLLAILDSYIADAGNANRRNIETTVERVQRRRDAVDDAEEDAGRDEDDEAAEPPPAPDDVAARRQPHDNAPMEGDDEADAGHPAPPRGPRNPNAPGS